MKDKDIAHWLGISPAYLSRMLKWAKSKYLQKNVNLQANLLSEARIPDTKLALALHRHLYQVSLISQPSNTILDKLKPIRINNNTQYKGRVKGVSFRITTKLLELEGIELWLDRHIPIPEHIKLFANAYSRGLAEVLEKELELSIDWATEISKLTEVEITEHDMTMRLGKDRKGLIPLHYDKNGKPDIWTDLSFGFRGWETNNMEYLKRLTEITNDIADLDAWQQMKQNQLEFTKLMVEYGQKLNAHIPLIETQTKLNKKLIQRLDEEKVFTSQAPTTHGNEAPISHTERLWNFFKQIFKRR